MTTLSGAKGLYIGVGVQKLSRRGFLTTLSGAGVISAIGGTQLLRNEEVDVRVNPVTPPEQGIWQYYVDLSRIEAGDEVVVRVYGKAWHKEVLMFQRVFVGMQSESIWMTNPLMGDSMRVEIEQTAGAKRSIFYSARRLG